MPIYDPQELSRYRKEHGLVSDDGSSRTEPSQEPPLTLLPLSSGGHSPTRASFQLGPAAPYDGHTDQNAADSPGPFTYMPLHNTSRRPSDMIGQPSQGHSPEARSSNLYPLYLQDMGSQPTEVNGTQAFQIHYGDLPVQQAYPNQGLPPSMMPAYSVAPMFVADPSMGLSTSVHRAPMQLQTQFQTPAMDYRLAHRQSAYSTSKHIAPFADHNGSPRHVHIQQHPSQGKAADDRMALQPPGFVPQELMMINVPHHMQGLSTGVQPTVNASPRNPQPSTPFMMNPKIIHSSSSAKHAPPRSVYPQQSINLGQRGTPREPRARSQHNQGSHFTPLRPTGEPAFARGYRQPLVPLPMQSVAFEAARGGLEAPPPPMIVGRGRGKGPGPGRKAGSAARGPRLPPPGVYPV
jgi:hypothetical protein